MKQRTHERLGPRQLPSFLLEKEQKRRIWKLMVGAGLWKLAEWKKSSKRGEWSGVELEGSGAETCPSC